MESIGAEKSSGIGYYEGSIIVGESPASIAQVAGLINNILFTQEKDGNWLPLPGDPTRREYDKYDNIYYTFNALAGLLDVGFPVQYLPIQRGFNFLDSFPGVSINYRPFYYLYLPLGKLSEGEVVEFLRILQKYQIRADPRVPLSLDYEGSFLLPQGWIPENDSVVTHWQGPLHIGGANFHACHLGYLLSQITRTKYPFAYDIAHGILEGIVKFFNRALDRYSGKLVYSDESGSPDLTLWLYVISENIGLSLPSNYVENIQWAIDQSAKGFLPTCFVATNLARLAQKMQLPATLIPEIEEKLFNTRQYLDKEYYNIRNNPKDASIALRAYLQIGMYFDKHYRYKLFSNLLRFYSEGFITPDDVEDWT